MHQSIPAMANSFAMDEQIIIINDERIFLTGSVYGGLQLFSSPIMVRINFKIFNFYLARI